MSRIASTTIEKRTLLAYDATHYIGATLLKRRTTSSVTERKEQFLLFRIRTQGDQEAFRRLLEPHANALYRFLFQKLPSREDAEDAFNTLSIRLWNYVSRSSIDHFSGLAFTIARGVVADYYRTRERKPETAAVDINDLSHVVEDERATGRTEAQAELALLTKRMGQLKEEYRIVITLKYFEGLTGPEIAKRLGKSATATRSVLHRATKQLRQLMEEGPSKDV